MCYEFGKLHKIYSDYSVKRVDSTKKMVGYALFLVEYENNEV